MLHYINKKDWHSTDWQHLSYQKGFNFLIWALEVPLIRSVFYNLCHVCRNVKKDKKQTHSHAAHHHNVILRERGGKWLTIIYSRQETHCHKYSTQSADGAGRWVFPGDCVPSTGWDINLWPGDLLSRSLFQTSATVRQPRFHHTQERDYMQTHTVSWLHSYMSFNTANNMFDIPQVRSISCCRLQVTGVRSQLHNYSSYSEFSTMVAHWVSFSSCSSSVPTCSLARDTLEVQSSTSTVIVTN